MDQHHLHSLMVIAECGAFSRAATRLGIAQPSLSRQIALLEEQAGTPLLYRHGRGATLTDAGQRLVEAARPVLASLDNLAAVLKDSDTPHGTVALGVPTFMASHLAGPIFRDLRAQHPRIQVRLMDGFSGFVNQWLTEGRVDVAIVYDARRSHSIGADPLLEDTLYLFGRKERRKELPDVVQPETLLDLDLVLPHRNHGLRRALDLAGAGGDPARVLEVDSLTAIRELVAQNVGWSVLPHAGVRREAADKNFVIRPIGTPPLRVKLMLATAPSRPVTPATHAVLRFLRETVQHLQQQGILSPAS